MKKYEELRKTADEADEQLRMFAPSGGEFPNSEECRYAIIKSKIARKAVDDYEQKAIAMHDELTLMLKRMLYGKWRVAEVEELLKKAGEK